MEPKGRLKFKRLKTLDPECRCCGKGTQKTCAKCGDMLNKGWAFVIELKDSSTMEKKKPTGYAIAFRADQVLDNTEPDGQMKPGIYFILQTDLKLWLKDDYNNVRALAPKYSGRLIQRHSLQIKDGGSKPEANPAATAGSRSIVELPHR